MEDHFLAVPIGRQFELTAVGACVVVCLRDVGRVAVEGCCPRVAGVFVDLVTIAFNFEKSWDMEVHPL